MSDDLELDNHERSLIVAMRQHELPPDRVRHFLTYDLPIIAERWRSFHGAAFSATSLGMWISWAAVVAEKAAAIIDRTVAEPLPVPDEDAEAERFDRVRSTSAMHVGEYERRLIQRLRERGSEAVEVVMLMEKVDQLTTEFSLSHYRGDPLPDDWDERRERMYYTASSCFRSDFGFEIANPEFAPVDDNPEVER